MGWIGIDLDGTLAKWGEGYNVDVERIGDPVPSMVGRVKRLLEDGEDVRIFTARVAPFRDGPSFPSPTGTCCAHSLHDCEECLRTDRLVGNGALKKESDAFVRAQHGLIDAWCEKYLGRTLQITCSKDSHMMTLYDDRCVQVVANTGLTVLEQALLMQRI